MRRIAAILLCIAMCLTVVPWEVHAEGTVQYAAVTAAEIDWSAANLVGLGDPGGGEGDPGGGGDPGPGGGAGALTEYYDAESNHYVVDSNCTVSPGNSVDLGMCSITVNDGVILTVEAGAKIDLRGVVFTNKGTIVIEADPAPDSHDHGRIEIRDDRYHDEGTGQDTVTPGILLNQGTITVGGNVEINDGAQLVNDEGAMIVVDNFLRFSGGAEMSNSGSVIGGEGGRIELSVDDRPDAEPLTISGLSFYDNPEDAAADDPTEELHGLFYYDSDTSKWIRSGVPGGGGDPGPGGEPGPGGSAGALTEYYDAESNHYVVDSNCTVSPENSVDLGMCSITVNAGVTLTVEAGARIDLRGVVFTNYGTIAIMVDPADDHPEHGRIEIRDDRYHDEGTGQDNVTPGILLNKGTITVGGNLEINDGAQLVNDEGAMIVVDSFLRFSGGAEMSNSGSLTGSEGGRIELFVDDGPDAEPLTVSGLSFYDNPEDAADDVPTEELHGFFYYDSVASKWIRSGGPGGGEGDPGPGGSAGALTEYYDSGSNHYVVSSNCTVSPENSVDLGMCSITVNAGVTLTVEAGARIELRGVVFTNNGTIAIMVDPADDHPEHGRIEIRDDRYHDEGTGQDNVTPGILLNKGTITVGGNVEINDGAQLVNDEGAMIVVDNFLRFSGGAEMSNSGSVIGGEGGRIELSVDDRPDAEPLTISGLSFYDNPEDAADDVPTEELHGFFYYDSVASKWIRSEGPGGGDGDPGPGGEPGGGGPRPWRIFTDFGIHGWADGPRDVDNGGDVTFILMPDEGFVVGPVTVTRQATGTAWESVDSLVDEGDGTYSIVVRSVTEDLILSVTFVSETPPTADSILQKSYAILVADSGSTEDLEAALRREIAGLGYVDGYSVTVTDVELPGDGEDYGTFRFTVEVDEGISAETTGYIVREPSNILFKVVGEHEGLEVNEVLMAGSDDAQLGVFELPAVDSGTIEVLGAYSAGIEGWLSPDVADGALMGGRYRIVATEPFYRLQMHIANRPANPADEVNWFGFDVIQADAYCVWVDESDGAGQQRTLQWELNRYAQLTTGDYTSLVFFGNDRFTLSLPPNGLGGVTEFSTPTGTFQGYTVSHDEGDPGDPTDDTYTVEFLSDFYDRITLEITINGSVTRRLHVHRVGVEISAFDLYGENRPGSVFHGTQYGSKVHYDDGTAYHIFATYCIPDGEDVPYGLYVTFTWADGSTTTEIIGAPYDPHKDPEDSVVDLFDWDRGVFVYPVHADPVDYLIYEAPTSAGAPVKVNVLVLKDDPNASGSFGGVFFGSGAGVEWQAD